MNRRANGAAISTIRKALGMKQTSLAASAGITNAYLSQIESGARHPPLNIIVRLADHLGVSAESISYPVPEPEPEPEKAATG